jgi:uncharacterized protein
MIRKQLALSLSLVMLSLAAGCSSGSEGDDGPQGPEGPRGPAGPPGYPALDPDAPLSAMVALSFKDDHGILDANGNPPANVAEYVKALVHHSASIDPAAPDPTNPLIAQKIQFPLAAASTDTVRTIAGLHPNVVVKWLDPLTYEPGMDETELPRFGTNADYIAYFGDGWDDDWSGDVVGSAPQFRGDDTAGWVWVNHEYISNDAPTATSAPTGQFLTLARFVRASGKLFDDVYADVWRASSLDVMAQEQKKQVGGSWMRIVQDPATGEWSVDRTAGSVRYDATSKTLLRLSGIGQSTLDHDDTGAELPAGVVVGISSDCSGGQTPWGTIFTGEENVQFMYGDLEPAWGSNQEFVPGQGFDPGSNISFPFEPSADGQMVGANVELNGHNRDFHGYLAEIDVGAPGGEYDGLVAPGVGHKKIGAMGRARWENATFVTDSSWKLVPGQPIVFYSGDDRRSGRVYKFVSSGNYTAGMTRAEVRALLDEGTVYAAHFADFDNATGKTLIGGAVPTEETRGNGQWIELSVDSADIAPNAEGLGAPNTTVGAALKNVTWNGIGGFATQDDVLWALFTASNKIGIRELNRPEDVEWNPLDPSGTPRLYIAFTNHNRRVALDQDGVMYAPEQQEMESPARTDLEGALVALEEADPANPAASKTFTFFQAFGGTKANGPFDAANPDNIMFDAAGGVWFGTDGNFDLNLHADSFYYLDLDVTHKDTPTPTYGKAFRVVAVPSDAEATGPAFSAGMGTLFLSVQHPGESVYSAWPQGRQ